MEKIKELLEARKEYLLQLKKEKEKALIDTPKGTLRISCGNGKVQYYQRNNPKDF